MPLNCGIVGLPNVGKSTIFSALTSAKAEAANYPFCTIDPNVGIVAVPDSRLAKLSSMFKPKKTVPAIVEFVDIAGLVRGASKGEGLGNQFLSHIREVGMIAHVVRCFDDPDIIHVANRIDPVDDIEVIHTELALADLDTVDKRVEKLQKQLKVQDPQIKKETERELSALAKIRPALEEGRAARSVSLEAEEAEAVRKSFLITMKREIYVCNTDEAGIKTGNAHIEAVKARATSEGSEAVVICGKFEAELGDLGSEEEKREFLAELGLEESGLSSLIHAAYRLLGLRTFFTAGEDECRAWTIKAGDKAPQAAGVIHTDFEKGFIKAEVYSYDDLLQFGTEKSVKEAGRLRQEGKEYIVQDGDIVFFKFNV
ncbi:MAG TPA: redox-regulated ATPase YchF [Rectinemataceae bacterium]|nr:redox-regulated ATPase YchF [Rectinemataceae bacterium]